MIKNSLFNLLGYLVPAVIGLPAIGYLARQLNVEMFGVFALFIVLVGYASIFDFGITRAVVRSIAINVKNKIEIEKIIGTSLILVCLMGVLLTFLGYQFSYYITNVLNVSSLHFDEVNDSIKILSLSLVCVLINQVIWSVYEGLQNFKYLNFIRIISSLFVIICPVVLVYFYDTLISAVYGIVVGRIISLLISYFHFSFYYTFNLKIDFSIVPNLLKYGSWLTVSNCISPLVMYFDRFLVSSLNGTSFVAYYSAPGDLVNRLNVIPASISKALFPIFSTGGDSFIKGESVNLYWLGVGLAFFSSFIVALPIFIFSKQILSLWLGGDFGERSYEVLQIFLVGFLFNSIAQIPYGKIQAAGKSKLTALIHLSESIPYLIFLYYMTYYFSILGAAMAWSFRMLADCLILFYFSQQIIRTEGAKV